MARTREFDEEAAFNKALDVFWQKGLRATTMLDLAQATGVQRGSLYNAYGDKEEVFVQAFERYAAEFLAEAEKALTKPGLRPALSAFFDLTVRTITKGTPARGCLSTKTAFDLDAASPRVVEALRTMLESLAAIVFAALSTDDRKAQLTVSPEEATQLIVAMTRALGVLERVYGDKKGLRSTASALINALARGDE
jgi:AcrR family transcriptional regulator